MILNILPMQKGRNQNLIYLPFFYFSLKHLNIKVFILFYRKLKVNKNNIKQNIPSPYMSPNNFNIIFAKK